MLCGEPEVPLQREQRRAVDGLKQSKAKQRNATQRNAKQSKAKQSKATQSKAKQSKAKQSKAKQSKQRVNISAVMSGCSFPRPHASLFYTCARNP
jgi:hypothetical protein